MWELVQQGAHRDLGRAPPDQRACIAGPTVAGNAHDGGPMAAPAGVNEGSPQEPISAGLAQADLAEAEAAEAEPAEGELAEVTPLEAEHLETESAEAELGETEPAAAEPAAAEPAAAEPAAAEPAELALAQADSAEGGPTWEAQEAGGEREGREGREGRDMSPLGITAIVLGIIALVGVAVGVLAVIPHRLPPDTVHTCRPARRLLPSP